MPWVCRLYGMLEVNGIVVTFVWDAVVNNDVPNGRQDVLCISELCKSARRTIRDFFCPLEMRIAAKNGRVL